MFICFVSLRTTQSTECGIMVKGRPVLFYSPPNSCPGHVTTTQAAGWMLVCDLECKRVSLLLLPVICHGPGPWGWHLVVFCCSICVAECLPASSSAQPTICMNWIQECWIIIRSRSWMTFQNPRELGRTHGHPVSPWLAPGVSIPRLLSLVAYT